MMNKKSCRASADTYPPLDARCGLLHAEQVDYIIRTSVKIIDHHRTLVLYIYDRVQAAAGNYAPVWTMFHGKDDYITLARQPDGTTKWRMAAFERLGNTWDFERKCAFYSAADRERVTRYFRDGAREGLDALIRAQWAIQERRTNERQRQRENAVMSRMLKADAKTRREFKAAYKKVMNNPDYEQDGMKIIYPASPEEIASEGNALHHCVGDYVDRVAKQE